MGDGRRGDGRRLFRWAVVLAAALALAMGAVAGCGENGETGPSDGDTNGGTVDGGGATPASPTAAGRTYQNAQYGFSVTWEPERFGVFEETAEGSGLGVLIGDASESTGPAAVKISLAVAGDGQTDYRPGSQESMDLLRALFDGIREDLSGAEYGSPTECMLGGLPGLCAEVEGAVPALPIDDPELIGRLYGTVWGTTTMLVFIGAPADVWVELEPELTQVVESITIDTGE